MWHWILYYNNEIDYNLHIMPTGHGICRFNLSALTLHGEEHYYNKTLMKNSIC